MNWKLGFCSGLTRIFLSISRMDSACAGSWSFMPSASNCCKRSMESYDRLSLLSERPAMTASRSMACVGASPVVVGGAAAVVITVARVGVPCVRARACGRLKNCVLQLSGF